jgi:hypothetical protein
VAKEKMCPFLAVAGGETCVACVKGDCELWCKEAKTCSIHALVHKGLEEA